MPTIALALARFDQAALGEVVQNPPERLFGDAQQADQSRNAEVGTTRNEVERALVSPPETMLLQDRVHRTGKRGVTELQELDTPPNLFLPKKKR